MEKKLNLQLHEINEFAELFNSMLKKKGHGMTFELTKNKFNSIKILKEVEEQIKIAQAPFLKDEYRAIFNSEGKLIKIYDELKDEIEEGQILGFEVIGEDKKELEEALNKLKNQNFEIDLIKIDSDLFENSCKAGIFDEIDLTSYFILIEKFN